MWNTASLPESRGHHYNNNNNEWVLWWHPCAPLDSAANQYLMAVLGKFTCDIHWHCIQVQHGHPQFSPAWASETEFKHQPYGSSWLWTGFHWCTGVDYTHMNTYIETDTHTHPNYRLSPNSVQHHPVYKATLTSKKRKHHLIQTEHLKNVTFLFLWPWKFTLRHTLIQEMRYFQSIINCFHLLWHQHEACTRRKML